jgi:hypothetical protein
MTVSGDRVHVDGDAAQVAGAGHFEKVVAACDGAAHGFENIDKGGVTLQGAHADPRNAARDRR